MNELRRLKQADVEPQLNSILTGVHDYTIAIVFENGIGSATLVTIGGFHGILTAYHVAEVALKQLCFEICFTARQSHRISVQSTHCQQVNIEVGESNQLTGKVDLKLGPDLSLIVIRDQNLLSNLRRSKSFFNVDSKDLTLFNAPAPERNWFVAGCPYEAKQVTNTVIADTYSIINYRCIVASANFHSYEQRGMLDYVDLTVVSGKEGYPENCEGMSGGGIWSIQFTSDSRGQILTQEHYVPILEGVLFYQTDIDDNRKTLSGHAWRSIYKQLKHEVCQLK